MPPHHPTFGLCSVTDTTHQFRTLIPQEQYIPPGHRGEFTPEDPIDFSIGGVLGISVVDALDGYHTTLDGQDDKMTNFKSASVVCRIQVGNMAF